MFKLPITLLDCDGILGDFNKSAIDFINQRTGRNYSVDDVTEWDVFESLGHKDLEPALDAAINLDEFCLSIPVYPGVKDALKELRLMSNVICVTAPHHADLWPGHRARWLDENLGFDRDHRALIHSKFLVYGDVFVDDSGRNVSLWKQWWITHNRSDTDALLWNRPYNKFHVDEQVVRITSWVEVLKFVEARARR